MNTIHPLFASSLDPNKVSLFISGSSNLIIGLGVFFAMRYGFDPTQAKTQLTALLDLAVNAVPAVWAVGSFCVASWGVVRKIFVVKS